VRFVRKGDAVHAWWAAALAAMDDVMQIRALAESMSLSGLASRDARHEPC